MHQVLWDQSLKWWPSPVSLPRVEGFWGGCGTASPKRLFLNSHQYGAFQRQGETLPAVWKLPLLASSLPWLKLKVGEPRSLYKHVLQGVKNFWAAMSWMRRLTVISSPEVQPLISTHACCPRAALGRRGSCEEVITKTWDSAPPEWTQTPVWGRASLSHFRKHHPSYMGHCPVKSNWISIFLAAFCCHSPSQWAGRNGTQGLQMEGAVLGLRQDGARNDPGMKRNTMGTKMQAKPAPGTSAG